MGFIQYLQTKYDPVKIDNELKILKVRTCQTPNFICLVSEK